MKRSEQALDWGGIVEKDVRIGKLARFYGLLDKIAKQEGGPVAIKECVGNQGWPKRGVYFVFEPGENQTGSGHGMRVVRVGTHGLKPNSRSTLWGRIAQHRGTRNPEGGNHRGSIFRLLVGLALLAREPGWRYESWSVGNNATREIRSRERELETIVSAVIGKMSVIWLPIGDEPGPESLRGYIERNSIALLSNFGREPIDPLSASWLGSYCQHRLCAGA